MGSNRIRRQRRKGRGGSQRVKPVAGRHASSRAWLERQLNDPYVASAHRDGYRARAAYKLVEIDDDHRILPRGGRILDLGAAPGSWCQVARERVGDSGTVVGLDVLAADPLPGATLVRGDVHDPAVLGALRAALGGPADAVLSDMAPNLTGHKTTDRLRVEAVVEAGIALADDLVAPGGTFLAKMLQAGGHGAVVAALKARADRVTHVKPPASRAGSDEIYVLATGYRPARG